jgi:hypothetical protein
LNRPSQKSNNYFSELAKLQDNEAEKYFSDYIYSGTLTTFEMVFRWVMNGENFSQQTHIANEPA